MIWKGPNNGYPSSFTHFPMQLLFLLWFIWKYILVLSRRLSILGFQTVKYPTSLFVIYDVSFKIKAGLYLIHLIGFCQPCFSSVSCWLLIYEPYNQNIFISLIYSPNLSLSLKDCRWVVNACMCVCIYMCVHRCRWIIILVDLHCKQRNKNCIQWAIFPFSVYSHGYILCDFSIWNKEKILQTCSSIGYSAVSLSHSHSLPLSDTHIHTSLHLQNSWMSCFIASCQ